MEYFWYILAAIGAGVGTGLAGLSAATVMVPILIVLCPSFGGETGAYQATAIALASDILGSAVTTYTYAKHKNIDLRRGWIMLVCILSMCTVGSYVAFIVGNVVLGGFTLFLTFFIGIRFLVKPDTSRKDQAGKGEKLDTKGIIISLFFGLTIGFGTGFVGTGGGMMMLVVFCRNQHLYHDLHGAYRVCKPYPDPSGDHPGKVGCHADLYHHSDSSKPVIRAFRKPGEKPYRRPCNRCRPDASWRSDAHPELLGIPFRIRLDQGYFPLYRSTGSFYRSVSIGPAAGPFSDEDPVLHFPKASAHSSLYLCIAYDPDIKKLAGRFTYLCYFCSHYLSSSCAC